MQLGPSLPDSIYWVAGVLFLANIGTIVSVTIMSFKGVWWLSKLDSRVKHNKERIDEAHSQLRQLKGIEQEY